MSEEENQQRSNQDKPKISANYRNRHNSDKPETPLAKYERAVEEYKALLEDKTHPDNRTSAYDKNTISIFNRLMVAADELDSHDPGAGVFGLIILALRASIALKDKNLTLEVKVRELEKKLRRQEKQ
jgi:hypothetical protein